MYEDLVRALRAADARPCPDMGCPGSGECPTAGCLFREAADAIEALQRACANYAEMATEQEWIPVKERLPENNGFYMVKVGATYRPIRIYEYKPCEWYEGENLWKADDGSYCFNHFVTHWMPLPDPPKEDEA